ncbi:hypothetical protein TNCV_18561 [Trichonephila clavipes]|nr:hypothetical protein TNCV_18561 [Trichonephila clavipes]
MTEKQAKDDADVFIVETAIEESEHHKSVIIIGKDIHFLDILIEPCDQYNGHACFNASRYENDLDEYCTLDPEILQDLETNILDDENNENEFEIFE